MDDKVISELKKPLDSAKVKTRKAGGVSLSYVEGWFVIDEANRIFGHDKWTRETVELIENTQPTKNKNGNFVVSFRAKVKVAAYGVVREGVGFGSGINFDIHSAYEGAIKEAETDAMKRALMTFGYPLGLALYDKDRTNVEDVVNKINDVQLSTLKNLIEKSGVDEKTVCVAAKINELNEMPSESFIRIKNKLDVTIAQKILEKHNDENTDTDTAIPAA